MDFKFEMKTLVVKCHLFLPCEQHKTKILFLFWDGGRNLTDGWLVHCMASDILEINKKSNVFGLWSNQLFHINV